MQLWREKVSNNEMLVLLLTLSLPLPIVERSASVAELNHVYDQCGKKCFTQLIVWDWSDHLSDHHVGAWALVKGIVQIDRGTVTRITLKQPDGILRVTAGSFRESWTQYDPEIDDRQRVPQGQRRGWR